MEQIHTYRENVFGVVTQALERLDCLFDLLTYTEISGHSEMIGYIGRAVIRDVDKELDEIGDYLDKNVGVVEIERPLSLGLGGKQGKIAGHVFEPVTGLDENLIEAIKGLSADLGRPIDEILGEGLVDVLKKYNRVKVRTKKSKKRKP